MIIEKFYETLKRIIALDKNLKLQTGIEAINAQLSNLVSAPAVPAHQSALALALESFSVSARELREALGHVDASYIRDVGGEEYFDPQMADRIQASIASNAMTPSVALEFVSGLATRRATFLATVRETFKGLSTLGVKDETLELGAADFAFLIPRELFDNKLQAFSKELSYLDRLVRHYGEAITGTVEEATLENLSSSIPTVALLASLPVILGLAKVVNSFLEAWAKIEKIRKIRSDLTDIGLKGTAVEELTEQITTTVEETVDESVKMALSGYKGEPGRRNELEGILRQDTRRLFGQIERGLVIQFRAQNDEASDAENQKALETVDRIGRLIEFPQLKTDPMLLTDGQLLEGDIIRVSKTKSTKTTTTAKKTIKRG